MPTNMFFWAELPEHHTLNNPILCDCEKYFIVSIIFHQPDFDGELLGHEEENILKLIFQKSAIKG